jgi:hypothetical protein
MYGGTFVFRLSWNCGTTEEREVIGVFCVFIGGDCVAFGDGMIGVESLWI